MSLADEYRRQLAWRSWPTVFDALPSVQGQTVLDLGCGVGDLSAELASRGARVVGVDLNEELLDHARSRQLESAEFRLADLRALPDLGVSADGLWSSFAAAYFPNLPGALVAWGRNLTPGGWIALTEIDDLLGHEPLSERTRLVFDTYAAEALAAGWYDVRMGRKLADHLEAAAFTVSRVMTLEDQEFSFRGPARPDVLEAWRARFERMALLREKCGAAFEDIRAELLDCLTRADHTSRAKVCCCIASKDGC